MKYNFYKKHDNRWYISLPEFNGSEEEREMVAGADIMLDIISEGSKSVDLELSLKEKPDFNELMLVKTNSLEEGGYYILKSYKNIMHNFDIWLCSVTLFVFGKYPSKIFFKKI